MVNSTFQEVILFLYKLFQIIEEESFSNPFKDTRIYFRNFKKTVNSFINVDAIFFFTLGSNISFRCTTVIL